MLNGGNDTEGFSRARWVLKLSSEERLIDRGKASTADWRVNSRSYDFMKDLRLKGMLLTGFSAVIAQPFDAYSDSLRLLKSFTAFCSGVG